MVGKKRPVRLEGTITVACIVLCLLSALPSGIEISKGQGSSSIIVDPSGSIQAAINNATAGATIFVHAGTYHESIEINKSISLVGENRDQTVIDGQNNQFIINVTASNVDVEGFTIKSSLNPVSGVNMHDVNGATMRHNIIENTQQGFLLKFASNNDISDNIVTDTQEGIALASSSNNVISDNTITANTQGGISLYQSNNNLFSGNMISGNIGSNGGVSIYASGGNVFSGNTFSGNGFFGETISFYSTFNIFYDNNFYDTVLVDDTSLPNYWDNGAEGNFWSNYAGHDRGYGIGIENYTVAGGNVDRYPLLGPFSSFDARLADQTFHMSVISNSSVSNFSFEVGIETGNRIIQFNATGLEGTTGFLRITIPTGLMNTSIIVLVGGKEVAPTWLNSTNAAIEYLYLSYQHSNQTIQIIYSKTLDLYNQLLNNLLALNATYYGLLSNYTAQAGLIDNFTEQLGLLSNYISLLQTYLTSLNMTFNGLLTSYADLLTNYTQLQQSYLNLNASYQEHLLDDGQNQDNTRSIMYIFAAATAILIIITIYFSRRTYPPPIKPPEED